MPKWKDYQNEAAAFFVSLGCEAKTDFTIRGTRTEHNVDVLVKSHHNGFDVTWVVECKRWKSRVTKLHVLALRGIVTDVGADRGILLSEKGFQSGAREAANLTNVQLTSLENLRVSTSNQISAMRLRELYDQLEDCRERYWNISKVERIADGLRPEVGSLGYSAVQVMDCCNDVLSRAFRNLYPFRCEALAALIIPEMQMEFLSSKDVENIVEPMIAELDRKLSASEVKRSR